MKKMILVPEALVDTLVRKDEALSTPELDAIVRLGKEMDQLRERRDISLEEKVRMYKEALRQYLHFRDEFREQTAPTARPTTMSSPPSPPPPAISVVDKLPKTYRKHAQQILDMIQPHLSYDKETMEITYGGKTVPGSNIVRLLHDTVSKTKRAPPIGVLEFSRAMTEAKVPSHLKKNKRLYPSPKKPTKAKEPRKKKPATDITNGWVSMDR